MLFKNVLSLAAALTFGHQSYAQDAKVLTLVQKASLTQHCLEGKLDGENGVNQILNSVLGASLRGSTGFSASQGNLVISDGRGKYAFVSMGAGTYTSFETLKKDQDHAKSRTGQVVQSVYSVMMVEQGIVTNTSLSVTDYLTGFNGGAVEQYCRVGTVRSTDLKDQKANAVMNILKYRELFEDSKTKVAAKAAIEAAAGYGKNKLTSEELGILKELLFGDMRLQNVSEAAKAASSLYEYALSHLANENMKAAGGTKVQEVSIRDEDVKKMDYNLVAMQAVVLKAGFEVIGKKAMFVGTNDLNGEGQTNGKYHASGARTHSILQLVRDPRALDILIVK